MSTPLDHGYIIQNSPMVKIHEKIMSSSSSSSPPHTIEDNNTALNLKETELRLGLPGSQSPERKPIGVSLFGKDLENGYSLTPLKNSVSGAKRGFSEAINGDSEKWVFSMNGKSDVNLGKGATFFSSRGEKSSTQKNPDQEKKNQDQESSENEQNSAPIAKAQVVGWPPIRSYRKNTLTCNLGKNGEDGEGKSGAGCLFVKVSMEGAPYLRKVDLKNYSNYMDLSSALEKMFSCFTIGQSKSGGLNGRDGLNERCLKDLLHGSEYVLTFEDKDSDWMLVGDVPWEMFTDTCRRLRIMKGSEAIGLAPRVVEKSKNRN